MSRRRKQDTSARAAEIRSQAKDIAGQSGEALKDFAGTTGSAAKEFADKAKDAAKELVESIERAAKQLDVEKQKPRRGGRFLRVLIVGGIGAAVFANDRVRNAIGAALGRATGGSSQPEVWRPETTTGDGKIAERVAEESS